jgi:polysaccharide pyruvyl transferase WcaK-like protein
MRDYFFDGYYGYKNVGDDVFCVIAEWGSKKYWKAGNISFMAQELPDLHGSAKSVIPRNNIFPGQKTVCKALATLTAKNYIYFGGSTLHSPQSKFVEILGNATIKRLFDKRISAIGVSIGPFKSVRSELAIKSLLKKMDYIAVRDKKSFEILMQMNIKVATVKSFDPAVLMLDMLADRQKVDAAEGKFQENNRRKILGVSLCYFEQYSGGDLKREKYRMETIKHVVKKFNNHGVLIRFFEFNGHSEFGDKEAIDEVARSLGEAPGLEIISYDSNPEKIFRKLTECDAVLGIRLHSAILAYTADIPFMLVEYHRKCSDFMDEIDYSDEHRIGDAVDSSDEIFRKLEQLLEYPKDKKPWGLPLAEARILALKNFTEAPFVN